MDSTTTLITVIASICIIACSIAAVAGAFYSILIWYPRRQHKRVEELKAAGRQGEATILRLPKHRLGLAPGRSSVFTMVTIGLEIRVPGIETYEVDRAFTFPTHALDKLEEGKAVAVWVDPRDPRNLDKIVIHVE